MSTETTYRIAWTHRGAGGITTGEDRALTHEDVQAVLADLYERDPHGRGQLWPCVYDAATGERVGLERFARPRRYPPTT